MVNSLPADIWLEWAPTSSAFTSDAACSWVRMTSPQNRPDVFRGLLQGMWKRGTDYNHARINAGDLDITFIDSRGDFNPLNTGGPNYGNLGPRKRIRLRCTGSQGAFPLTLWSGVTTGFYPDWNLGFGWTNVKGVDNLAPLAIPVWDSALFGEIQSTNPLFWFPLSEGGGGTSYNIGSAGGAYTMVHTGTDPHVGGTIAGYGTEVPVGFGAGSYTSLYVNGALDTQAAAGTTFTIMTLVMPGTKPSGSAASGFLFHIGSLVSGSAYGAMIYVTLPGGLLTAGVSDGLGNSNAIATTSTTLTGGGPFIVILRYNMATSQFNVRVNDVQTNFNSSSAAGNAFVAVTPATGAYVLGNQNGGANPLYGNLSHHVFWNSYLADSECTSLYNRWAKSYVGDTADVRIGRFLAASVVGTGNYVADVGVEHLGPASYKPVGGSTTQWRAAGFGSGGLAVDLCRRAANTDGGRFFCNRNGQLVFQSRAHVGNQGAWYDTNPAASDWAGGSMRTGVALAENQSTFETGLDSVFYSGVNAGLIQFNAGTSYQGTFCARANATAATAWMQSTYLPVTPGTYVSLGCAVRTSAAATFYNQITFYDANHTNLSSVVSAVVSGTSFQWLQVAAVAPANTASVVIFPFVTTTAVANNTFDVDLVTFDTFVTPAANRIPLTGVVFSMDDKTFYNEATVQIAAPQPVAQTIDAASVAQLGPVAWNEPTEFASPTAAAAGAARIIGTGLPKTQIKSATILYHDDLPDEVLTNDIGDRITAVARPPGCRTFVQPSTIIGVGGKLDGRALTLEVDWYLTP